MPKPNQSSLEFRNDINGLRAWAVAAVVLFHFGVPGFGGGFVGVDIFFVISGYLMTRVLVTSMESNKFSLWEFYLARARRIIPALLAVCLVLLLAGWVLLLPPDLKTMAAHVAYSVAFVSNIEYWLEAGYFDAASHEKWLLHTWSLSVEWQFYLLLPFFIWAAWAWRPRRSVQAWALLACMVVSLAACVVLTRINPSAAFFLLPTRAWEMLAGGLVWLVPARLVPAASRAWLHGAGLALIGLSIALFDKSSAWPGWNALLPVAASALVILAQRGSRLTDSAPAQWLGDRSYSIYLWHWPVAVLCQYMEVAGQPWAIAAGLLATLVLAHASYHWVERPAIALSRGISRPRFVAFQAAALLVVLVPALLVWRAQGVQGRFAPAHEALARASDDFDRRQRACHRMQGEANDKCVHGKGAVQAVVVGDSHAAALMPAVAGAGGAGAAVGQWTYSACPFVPGMRKTAHDQALRSADYRCEGFIDWARAKLEQLPAGVPVVLIGRYAGPAMGLNEDAPAGSKPSVFFSRQHATASPEFLREFGEHITRSACELARRRSVYMVRPIPEMGVDVPKLASRRGSVGRPTDVSISREAYLARNGWVIDAQDAARERCGVKIIDPLPRLCDATRCYGVRNNVALYHDDDHLSREGSALIAPLFRPVFARAQDAKLAAY